MIFKNHLTGKGAVYSISELSSRKQPVFRVLWIATLVSNIGSWMQNTGAPWLMTSLTSSVLMVALVQTAEPRRPSQ
jgi:hypothetical protein